MSLVDIQVVGLDEAISNMSAAEDLTQNLGQGLLEVVDSVVMPAVQDASSTVWNVRTGDYSTGWISELADPNTVTISNAVEYAAPLEYGWTLRNGGFMDSPGVAIPTVLGLAGAIGEGLAEWIASQLPR